MGMDRPPFSSERIMDANGYVVSRPNGAVLMRRNKKDIEPLSVPSFVKHHCLLGGNQLAMAVKRNGDWMRWTYSQYYMEIRLTAKGFIRLGLEPHHTVCIYGFNCPEWHIADLGAIFAGGFATGLYPTNSGPTNEYLMNNSRCQILVVENNATLCKVKGILSRVTTIKKVVVIEEEGFTPEEGTILWKDLLKMGGDETDKRLNEIMGGISVNQCCSLIYTSGTTGNPKGVMLSHDNITFTASALVEKHDWKKEVVVVSYLPLSHIAANMLDIFVVMRCRGQVFFADKSALKGSLVDSLREVQPTLFFGVPRIYEKFHEGIMDKFNKTKKHEKWMTDLLRAAALSYNIKGDRKLTKNLGQRLLYQKVKTSLGLDRVQEFICGGAPLMSSTQEFFLSLDIVIKPGYGLSECGCVSNFAPGEFKRDSCGSVFPSTEVRVVKSEEGSENGELRIRGRGIMMGYLNDERAIEEAFDADGFFKTGDLGQVDSDGFYYITGRQKELLVTAGGENIAPILIESNIKACLPVVSNVIAIGDLRKFVSVFLTLKVTRDSDGAPTTRLTKGAQEWCTANGSNAKEIMEIIRDSPSGIMRAIQRGIDEANEKAISNAAKVKKWCLMPRELSSDHGEIGPTLKLKRSAFNKLHSKQIEKIYQ